MLQYYYLTLYFVIVMNVLVVASRAMIIALQIHSAGTHFLGGRYRSFDAVYCFDISFILYFLPILREELDAVSPHWPRTRHRLSQLTFILT